MKPLARRARWKLLAGLAVGVLALALAGAGTDGGVEEGSGTSATTQAQEDAGGLIPKRLVWPGVVVIVVVAIIVTAALTGPIIRANTDDDRDEAESPE